jgi:hypothetical protein
MYVVDGVSWSVNWWVDLNYDLKKHNTKTILFQGFKKTKNKIILKNENKTNYK